jgi:hypothetical protein
MITAGCEHFMNVTIFLPSFHIIGNIPLPRLQPLEKSLPRWKCRKILPLCRSLQALEKNRKIRYDESWHV